VSLAHRIVAIVLLLALPVKGAFAASMLLCASHHPHDAAAAATVAGDHHAVGHAHHDHAGRSDSDTPSSTGFSNPETVAQHADVQCALCAACCVGGACVNSLPLGSPVFERGDPAISFIDSSWVGIVPDPLDRPPIRSLV
jgi:hypothetical protein